jgi:hypothetical protein
MLKWAEVMSALENKKYRWRTVRGVAKELKASDNEVLALIQQHGDEIIKSSVPAETGEDLFSTRRHYRANASPYAKITSSLTQAVSAADSSSIVSTIVSPKDKKKEGDR